MSDCTLSLDSSSKEDVTVFCICCLQNNVGSYVSLLTCTHGDFLNLFVLPEIKPNNQVVCHQCHAMLKKIKVFKGLVQDSFKIIADKTNHLESTKHKENKYMCYNIFNFNIPEVTPKEQDQQIELITKDNKTIKQEIKTHLNSEQQNTISETAIAPKSLQTKNEVKKLKNIEAALKIINSNQNDSYIKLVTTSLQSITETIIIDSLMNSQNSNSNILNNIGQTLSTAKIILGNSTEKDKSKKLPDESILNPQNTQILSKIGQNLSAAEINLEKSPKSTQDNNLEELPDQRVNLDKVKSENKMPVIFEEDIKKEDCNTITLMDVDPPKVKARRPFSSTSIARKISITRDQLMQERDMTAKSKKYLKMPHHCVSCQIGFKYNDNLQDHLKRKHTLKPGGFECDVCKQVLFSNLDEEEHKLKHSTRYECKTCKQCFVSYAEVFDHYRNKHEMIYKCQRCPYVTNLQNKFDAHIDKHRGKRKKKSVDH